jgi:hypothetical protein
LRNAGALWVFIFNHNGVAKFKGAKVQSFLGFD